MLTQKRIDILKKVSKTGFSPDPFHDRGHDWGAYLWLKENGFVQSTRPSTRKQGCMTLTDKGRAVLEAYRLGREDQGC